MQQTTNKSLETQINDNPSELNYTLKGKQNTKLT
jgi:hypothetical protein